MKEPPVLENMSVESSMQTEIRNGDLKTDNKESIDKNVDENAHNGPIHNDCTLKIHEKTVLLSPNTEESIKTGIDNLAFESDTLMANGKSENHKEHNDFNLNQSSIDQKLKDDSDYKTTEEIAEAVNLELLNMGANLTNGLNGIPVKNPNSTVINMSSPYDEYFIPVNEHRKYIRGEKLYVTKNKRDLENSKKNCCVWIAGLVTAMVAICLAILIATKFNQDPLSANERRSQDGNILNAGIGYGSSDPVSNFQNSRTTSSTADFTSEYLKQALEGEFTIDNLTFTPGLADHDSKEFKEVATSVEEELKEALFDHSILTYGSANIYIRVINLTPENVVQYRIGWVFKPGIQNPPDPINVNSLKDKLKEYIRKKQGFLYNYRVPVSKIYSKNMINDCLINNGNCSDSCTFDYEKMLDFFCTCPENFKLDKTQYNCEPITDFTTEIKPELRPESEPTSELEPKSESSATSQREPKSEGESTFEPELSSAQPKSEPETEPVPTFQAEPSTKLVPKSEEETTIQTKTKLESELKFLLEPGAKSVSEFTSQSESKSELELTTMIPSSKLESSLETNNDSHASKNVNIIPEYTATTPENTKHSLEIINKANNSKENISMLTNLVLGRNLNGITMKPNVMMNDISIISPENIEDSVIEQVTKATSDQINIDGFSLNTTKKLQNVSNDSALINSVSNAKLDSISAEVTTVSDIRKQPDEEEKVEGKISTDETILDDLVENTSIPVTKNIKDGVEINLGSAKTDVLNVSAKINETETEESNLKNSNDLNAVENINYGTKVNLNVTDLNVKLNTEANTENIPTSTYDKVSINISDIEKENLSPTDAKVEDINNNIPLTGEVTKSKVSIDVNSELAADAKNVENDNFEQNNSKISEEPKKKISLEINNSSESTESSSLPNEISLDDEKTGNNITLNDQLQKISDSNPHLQPVFDVRLIKNDSNNCDNNTDNKLCNFTNAPVPLIKLNSSLNMDNSLTGNIGLSPKSMFFQFDPAEKTVKLENSDDNANQRINTSKRESLKSDKQEQNAVVTDKKQSSGKELTDSERKSSPLKGEQKKIESRRSIKNRLSLFDFLSALQKTLNTSAH
ncbi:hypothetical protein PGB90_007565 [Kerria lacca]